MGCLYLSSDWDEGVSRSDVGEGWRVVAENERFDDYQPGDIVSFADGEKRWFIAQMPSVSFSSHANAERESAPFMLEAFGECTGLR